MIMKLIVIVSLINLKRIIRRKFTKYFNDQTRIVSAEKNVSFAYVSYKKEPQNTIELESTLPGTRRNYFKVFVNIGNN